MPLWYPDEVHIELIRSRLATRFFSEYEETSSPQFGVLGGREGMASLDSALNVIRQPYYRGIHNKAAALLRSMIKNHPFIDGNKRIALVITLDFLLMNGHLLIAPNSEMVRFALEVARSEPDMPWEEVAVWIRKNCATGKALSRRAVAERAKHLDEALLGVIQQVNREIDQLVAKVTKRLGSSR